MNLHKLKQLLIFGFLLCVVIGSVTSKAQSNEVTTGKQVSIEYTLTLKDKSVVDSNVGAEPLTFVQGSHAVLEIEKEQIPQGELKIGSVLQGQNADGQIVHARVKEIKEKTVLLDFNHPLASKTLYFDIKVLDVQEAPAG